MAEAEAAWNNVQLKRFPFPFYTKDAFLFAIQFALPLLLMLSLLFTVSVSLRPPW